MKVHYTGSKTTRKETLCVPVVIWRSDPLQRSTLKPTIGEQKFRT